MIDALTALVALGLPIAMIAMFARGFLAAQALKEPDRMLRALEPGSPVFTELSSGGIAALIYSGRTPRTLLSLTDRFGAVHKVGDGWALTGSRSRSWALDLEGAQVLHGSGRASVVDPSGVRFKISSEQARKIGIGEHQFR